MPIVLPRLCVLTDRALAGGASHDQIVASLIRAGVRWIQVREKLLPPGAFLRQAKAAVTTAREAGGAFSRSGRGDSVLIVVNDRADIALAAAADGVHVGRDDLPPADARRLMGPDRLVGVSTHTVEEAIAASKLPVDYVAIGPVFPTRTKRDADPVVGLETVRRAAAAIELPLVAIGGIGPENARSVLDAGAAAVAVVSAVHGGPSIEENVRRLLARLVRD